MTDIPHFDLPFRIKGASAATVEQDSIEEIANCVLAAIKTELGTRKELPTFGTPDLTFRAQPLDYQSFIDQVIAHEPRANILIETDPKRFDELVASVALHVSARQEDVLE